ncbi:MAG TPA: hypothetical protein VLK33_03095 [Terriglobales bacterium]|jgi:hypothetical protein|nr:hypothetical protein [Terriglobales bacterium]
MKEVNTVLKQKELDLARVANEVQALQMVAPLLMSEKEVDDEKEATSDSSQMQVRDASAGT